MNYSNVSQANVAFEIADKFFLLVPGGRITIASEHTDKAGKNVRHWLHFQKELDTAGRYEATGTYLEKNGEWISPRGAKYRRHFSTPSAAIKYLNKDKKTK